MTESQFYEKHPLKEGLFRIYSISANNTAVINIHDCEADRLGNEAWCAKMMVKSINAEDSRNGNHSQAFLDYENCMIYYKNINSQY